ncbi:phosphotransferase [Nocardioides sp.]|uniref:phosphotransferase n=1 Tax=Nocardioides sp. TaxID=35761 RepID=UPI002ED5805C
MSSLDEVAGISARQRDLLAQWLPGARVVRDHSWGLVERTVLEVEHGGETYVVKAGGPDDHHMERELRAHREWLSPWTSRDRAPVLVHADEESLLLVTRFLPGQLVEGSAAADDPEVFRQAGRLLALLHHQPGVVDAGYEPRENRKMISWLDREHRIEPGVEQRLRDEIARWPEPPATLVPTHGDWQPRNWLHHDGVVRAIDFGRADLRPAYSDLARLAAQDFRRDPARERSFLAGYGADPREPAAWHRQQVREAIGTAVWAYQVGDERFEAQGHRMIAEALGP